MKIYSWNVYVYNNSEAKVLRFIDQSNFDVFVLQEVSDPLLKKLENIRGWHIFSAIDHRRISGNKKEVCHLVILSKYPVKSSLSFPTKDEKPQLPRTKAFTKMMSMLHTGWVEKVVDHHAQYADIIIAERNQTVRIFNTHLTNGGPTERLQEFAQVRKYMQANFVTIICGDFNIIETPVAKVGNWLLGAPIKEGLPWYNERVIFEKLFKSLSLQNPLSKKGTYKYFNNQLDHILVPENWKVKKAEVIKNSHGSDHYPIFVEIDIL